MNYNFSKEDLKTVERFIEIKKQGYYVDGTQLTEVYNRVLNRNVNVTNCGSCLRGRVQELEDALRNYKAQKAKEEEENNKQKAEENGEENKGLDNDSSAERKAKTRKTSKSKTA